MVGKRGGGIDRLDLMGFGDLFAVLLIPLGLYLAWGGIRTWVEKRAELADPLLFGLLTGFVGYIVVRLVFGDFEVRGVAARMLAVYSVIIGLGLSLFGVTLLSDAGTNSNESDSVRKGNGSQAHTKLEQPAEPDSSGDLPVESGASTGGSERRGTVEPMPEDWLPDGMERR